MKHIKNFRPLVLAAILVVTSAAAAVCGLVMKGQLQKYVGGYDDKWAIAVPFLMLRDDTDWQRMLAAKDAPPAPDPEPEPEPEPDPEPEPEPEPPGGGHQRRIRPGRELFRRRPVHRRLPDGKRGQLCPAGQRRLLRRRGHDGVQDVLHHRLRQEFRRNGPGVPAAQQAIQPHFRDAGSQRGRLSPGEPVRRLPERPGAAAPAPARTPPSTF